MSSVVERFKAKHALPYLRVMLNDHAWLHADGQVTVADVARRFVRSKDNGERKGHPVQTESADASWDTSR